MGQLTPKIIYFYYLQKYCLVQSIQKTFYLILKTEALIFHIVISLLQDSQSSTDMTIIVLQFSKLN